MLILVSLMLTNFEYCFGVFNPLSASSKKMIKHTQTIRRQIADELSVSDHFVGLALKGLLLLLTMTEKEHFLKSLKTVRSCFKL